MNCVVLHQAVPPSAAPDEQDVLAAAASVAAALRRLGWEASTQAVSLDLAGAAERLRVAAPDLVFNLVESLDGDGPLCAVVPALLHRLGLRFTGNGAAALALTADKPATRRALRQAGIPVPAGAEDGWPGPFIVKRAGEHASQGLGPDCVIPRLSALPPGFYAEAFIDGREYNIAMLDDGAGGCTVLPIAETAFADGWPADRPRILDYGPKWDPTHPLYAMTVRRFGADPELALLACRVWSALGLAGYARIDLRVSHEGVAYVIDVNANPCLAEDAGFAAAAAEAGLDYTALVGKIVGYAKNGDQGERTPSAHHIAPAARGRRLGGPLGEAVLRRHLHAADPAAIAALCRRTGFFSEPEIAVAEELAADCLARGAGSDYRFLIAQPPGGQIAGYACYGPVAATRGAWDLYWIVVDPAAQRSGRGRALLDAVLAEAATQGGRQLYAETESSPLYIPTRAFYAGCGFLLQAALPDFYAPGLAKLIFMRPIGPADQLSLFPSAGDPGTLPG
jgi:D-alanine-D-alanine ligase